MRPVPTGGAGDRLAVEVDGHRRQVRVHQRHRALVGGQQLAVGTGDRQQLLVVGDLKVDPCTPAVHEGITHEIAVADDVDPLRRDLRAGQVVVVVRRPQLSGSRVDVHADHVADAGGENAASGAVQVRPPRLSADTRGSRWIAWCCSAVLLWTLGARPLGVNEAGVDSPTDTEGRLRRTVEYFSSLGSRVAGYPGADSAAAYIERQFGELGLQSVRAEAFQVAVPIDGGAFLELPDGTRLVLYSIWPPLLL